MTAQNTSASLLVPSDYERGAKAADDADRAKRANDTVNHPPHYTAHPSGVECIDVVEHMSFNVGNAVKYLWRAGLKSPDAIEDLRKARWYIEREIERVARRSTT